MSKKTVIILSGGLDSTVLTYHLRAAGNTLKLLSFNYGQRHKKELEYAKKTASELNLEHQIVDLTSLTKLLGGSSQTDSSVDVPFGHYAANNMATTVVANRNSIMLNIAAAWAMTSKFDSVSFAAHRGDFSQYADCRPEFAEALDKCIGLADYHKVVVDRPFILLSKAEIVSLGDKLSVPWDQTWSCYSGGEIHEGRCGTCVERLEAFDVAGVKDPTEYADREYYKKVLAEAA